MSPRIDNLNLKIIDHATPNVQVRAVLTYITGVAEVASLKTGWTIVFSDCFLLSPLYTVGQKMVIILKFTAVSTSNALRFDFYFISEAPKLSFLGLFHSCFKVPRRTTYFRILSNSLFTNRPIIRRDMFVLLTASLNKP